MEFEKINQYRSIVILAIGFVLTACAVGTKDNSPHFTPPDSWRVYSVCNNRCSVFVPNSLELRKADDAYSKRLGAAYIPDVAIFQQKGLSKQRKEKVDEHYCRVIIQSFTSNDEDLPSPTEQFPFDSEWNLVLRQLVDYEISGWTLLSGPTYHWIDIGGRNKAIEINYQRNGNNGNTTNGTIYLLFNHNIMVKMVVAYRESEKELWIPDVKNIIYTFKWIEE